MSSDFKVKLNTLLGNTPQTTYIEQNVEKHSEAEEPSTPDIPSSSSIEHLRSIVKIIAPLNPNRPLKNEEKEAAFGRLRSATFSGSRVGATPHDPLEGKIDPAVSRPGSLSTPRSSLEEKIDPTLEKMESGNQEAQKIVLQTLRTTIQDALPQNTNGPSKPKTNEHPDSPLQRLRSSTISSSNRGSLSTPRNTPRGSVENPELSNLSQFAVPEKASVEDKIPKNWRSADQFNINPLLFKQSSSGRPLDQIMFSTLLRLFPTSNKTIDGYQKGSLQKAVLAFIKTTPSDRFQYIPQALLAVRNSLLWTQIKESEPALLDLFYSEMTELFKAPGTQLLLQEYSQINVTQMNYMFSKQWFSKSSAKALKLFFFTLNHEFHLTRTQYNKDFSSFSREITNARTICCELLGEPPQEFYGELSSSVLLRNSLFPVAREYLIANAEDCKPIATEIINSLKNHTNILKTIEDLGSYELIFDSPQTPFRGTTLTTVLTTMYGNKILEAYLKNIRNIIDRHFKNDASLEKFCIDYKMINAQLSDKETAKLDGPIPGKHAVKHSKFADLSEDVKTQYIYGLMEGRIAGFTNFSSAIFDDLYALELPKEGKELLHIYRNIMRKGLGTADLADKIPGAILSLRLICPTIINHESQNSPWKKSFAISLTKILQALANHMNPGEKKENPAFSAVYKNLHAKYFEKQKQFVAQNS